MTFYDAGTVDEKNNPINYHYQIITFTKGMNGIAYQEVDSNGQVIRFTDIDGNSFSVGIVEYFVSDSNPLRPLWGN